jgi:adenylate kinase family enzyme
MLMNSENIKIHCVIGQAGSGKSTFINENFLKDEHIFYNVGSILRKMFGASIGKKQDGNKNTWDFADPLVYNIFDHCHHISRTHNIPMVSDGFPRNVNQLDYMDKRLRVAEYGKVEINFHLLDISEKEQVRRILERNGKLDQYHIDRIAESRRNFEHVIERLEGILLGDTENVIYGLNWYKQEDGSFQKISTVKHSKV